MNETQKAVSAAANPQAALLQIAVSLDRLHDKLDGTSASVDPWGEWDKTEAARAEYFATHDETGAKTTLNVTIDERGEPAIEEPTPLVPSGVGYQERYDFAHDVLQLADSNECEDYALWGPTWFYGHHRDIVIQYGRSVHVRMIQDAETYDPQSAAEMGRDLLKSTATGMSGGVMVAQGTVR